MDRTDTGTRAPDRMWLLANKLSFVRNFVFLAAARAVGDGIMFVLFVALSRVFGQEGAGRYSFAIGFAGFFAIFADF